MASAEPPPAPEPSAPAGDDPRGTSSRDLGPSLAMVLASAALAATVPALPLWLDALGVHDPAELATLTAVAFGGGVVASMLVTPLWGALGDRMGHRAMAVRACLGLALAQVLMAMATDPLQVVGIRVLQGAVSGVEPALLALAVARHGAATSGRAIGRLESASTVGALLGPVAMTAVVLVGGFPSLFFGAAGSAVIAAALVLRTVPSLPPVPRPRASLLRDVATAARGPGVPGLLLAVGTVVALDVVVELLYPLMIVAHTDPGPERVALLGAIELVGEAAYLIAAPWLGARVDARGPAAVLVPCGVLAGLTVVLAPWMPWPWIWVGLVALGDGASSGVRAALYAEVPRRGVPQRRGAVMSLVASANRAGAALASVVVPLAVAMVGLGVAMTGAGAATVAVALSWTRPRPRRSPAAEPEPERPDR